MCASTAISTSMCTFTRKRLSLRIRYADALQRVQQIFGSVSCKDEQPLVVQTSMWQECMVEVPRMHGVNASAENERYAKPLAEWGPCHSGGCAKLHRWLNATGYTRHVPQHWLCEDCQLRGTARHEQQWKEHPWQSWESWTAWQPSTWTTWESQYENTRTTWEDDEDDEWTTQNTHSQPTSSRAHSRPRRVQVTSEQRTSETSRPTPAPNHSGDISQDRPILLKNNWANQDSHSRSHQQSHGRKAAYIAQQALRQYCLENHSWHVDLNDDAHWPLSDWPRFDWKKTLLVMSEDARNDLIADGITSFQFLLLRNVKDQNYPKPRTQTSVLDTGERHVFEITQCDGTKWHLHYHKNGTHDSPHKIPPFSSIWHVASMRHMAWEPHRPDVFSQESIFASTPEHNTALGTGELCKALYKICAGETTRDITDMQAVHWHRWLRTLTQGCENPYLSMAATYIGPGIERVFAFTSCRHGLDDKPLPTIVFAHPNDTYTSVDFSPARKDWRREHATHEEWKNHHMFSNATKESRSWLRIPDAR